MLVYLRKWSQDPVLLAKNIVVVLVTESLAELDPKLVRQIKRDDTYRAGVEDERKWPLTIHLDINLDAPLVTGFETR